MASAFSKGKFKTSARGSGTSLSKSGPNIGKVSGSRVSPNTPKVPSSKRGAGTSIAK